MRNATEVNVRLDAEDGHLTLEVHDNGGGVSEEQPSAGGPLGILGMRERARLLGGELAIAGALGAGTTVKVWIPETHPTLSKVRQVIRILIADDHPILRSGLKEILVRELKGATCGEAGNAQHVLSEVHREHWDLVILDVTMSGRSGLDVLRELRRLRPQTARVGFERAS